VKNLKEVDEIVERLDKIQKTLENYLKNKKQELKRVKEAVVVIERFVEENFSTRPIKTECSDTRSKRNTKTKNKK